LETIPFGGLSGYFDFDLEVIACALSLGLKVGELAIPTCYADEDSHLNPWIYGLKALRMTLRYRNGYYARLLSRAGGQKKVPRIPTVPT